MSIFEYDQEKHMRQERKAAWEDGHAAGIEEGIRETVRNFARMGIPIETIAGAVKVNIEEVQNWIDNNPDENQP